MLLEKRKMIRVGLATFFIVLLLGCKKDDANPCEQPLPEKITYGKILGTYENYGQHKLSINLKNEICLISRDEIVIYPFDPTESVYRLQDQFDFNGVVVTEFDTIVQRENTFYRFYPSTREFSYIYTPPYSIHDFCVTSNHGIGYYWGNIFVESMKFNYFNFEQNTNQTIFEFSEFFQETAGQYGPFQTYFRDNKLHLLMRTGDASNFIAGTGVFYNINLDDHLLESRLGYTNKIELKVLDFNNFNTIDVSYGVNGQGEVAAFNWRSLELVQSYRYPINFLNSSYYINNDYLSISLHSISPEKITAFINWKTHEILFSTPTPKEFQTPFVRVRHYQNEYLLLYQQRFNIALVYNSHGCISNTLIANGNFHDIMYLDNERIIVLNDQKQIEYFNLN